MVDIHSHILAGVDDGARSLEESVKMCQTSFAEGVTTIIATPHAHDGVHVTHRHEFLQQKVAELNAILKGEPKIELGCELRFTHEVVSHLCFKKSALPLAGSRFALIEFPSQVVPLNSDRAFFELMNNGIRPIIAHPERNIMLMAQPEKFFELVEMGVFGQADVGSFTGQFGSRVKETVELLLENGLLHFVASDCHNMRNRLPGMMNAVHIITEIVGEEYARAMAGDNPQAIAEDKKDIPLCPVPQIPKKKKKWFFF